MHNVLNKTYCLDSSTTTFANQTGEFANICEMCREPNAVALAIGKDYIKTFSSLKLYLCVLINLT